METVAVSPQTPVLPKLELIETPKYKELKQRVDTQRRKVEELESERQRLTIVYTDSYSKVKENAKRLTTERNELEKLELQLEGEFQKLKFQEISPRV